MKTILCLVLTFLAVNGIPVESDGFVDPEYLDQLRAEGRHEEFSKLMGIPDPKFVQERNSERKGEVSRHEAMFNPELLEGDIMPSIQEFEEGRQGLRFERYRGSRWPHRVVPYVISGDFDANQRRIIQDGINHWNSRLSSCIRLVQRSNQRDFVYVFSGDGCWSDIGRRGNQQSLSLERNGCLHNGAVIHEFQHAIGFAHEQNRYDRDHFIEVQWHNIPNKWKSQYEKTNSRDFNLLQRYDYYSIMHYPVNAPGTNRPAFRVRQHGIDQRRIGNGYTFTDIDLRKIRDQYGC